MKRIILDTVFLMVPYQFGVDNFSELKRIMDEPYTLAIVDKTLDELDNIIKKGTGRDKKAAGFAKTLVEKEDVEIIQTETFKNVDSLIVDLARPGKDIVATQDKGLKERLKGVRVITLRQKNHLE